MKFSTNSKTIQKGQIFVALKGNNVDGHDFINEAINNGARKIICEKNINVNVPIKTVKSTSDYLQYIIPKLYKQKLKKIKIIGITGTNGKTTSAYLTYQLLNKLGIKTAYLGTIGFYLYKETISVNNTTPNIVELYTYLLEAIQTKCQYFVMEVSSHALEEERIKGLKFDVAAFTNLTQDHLDYHKTMDNYLKSKLKIINYIKKNGYLIINNDNEYAPVFTERFKNIITFGKNGNLKIMDYILKPNLTKIIFNYNKNIYTVTTNLIGLFNIYNYFTALLILISLNIKIDKIINNTKYIYAPKGRCQIIKINDAFVIIDYAHTPDAVLKVLDTFNELKDNKLITIIGCGGNRDKTKRPLIGKIVTQNSDYVIFTNDNPRKEPYKNIIKDITSNLNTNNYIVEYNRKKAIKKGIDMLGKDDLLLILGKGHENYQINGNKKHYFSDEDEVLKWKKY